MRLKSVAKAILPPVFLDWARRSPFQVQKENVWSGDYDSWAAAVAASGGYDSGEILERVYQAGLKVKRGERIYERDGVLFDQVEYSWPILAGLMWAAARTGGRLDVVDFGGSFGSSYFQNRTFLKSLSHLRWNVVEQSGFVDRGRLDFQDDTLRFYDSIDSALAENTAHVLLLSSVLQYLERPYELLEVARRFQYVIVDLTPAWDEARDQLVVQTVPPSIYTASYPCWIFSEQRLRSAFQSYFQIVASFDAHIGQRLRIGKKNAGYRGYLLERTGTR